MKILKYIFLSLLFLGFISCTKETLEQEEIETGLLCDIEREMRYSEWCINSQLKYHIGYPDTLCFDSLLMSLPVTNNELHLYGNYPTKQTNVFLTTFEEWSGVRYDWSTCNINGKNIEYVIWIEIDELIDPQEVSIKMYFYEDSEFPTDSLDVLLVPWNF